MQQRLGEQHIADRNAPCILTEIADNVGPFLRAQTLAAVSSRDAAGQVWTSLLLGAPGCAWAPTPTQLRLEEALLKPSPADVLWHNLREHSEVSVLFIDLGTRWRYRVNGRAHAVAGAWTVAVEQAFLNCPQYIHKRALALVPGDAGPSVVPMTGTNLTPELLE